MKPRRSRLQPATKPPTKRAVRHGPRLLGAVAFWGSNRFGIGNDRMPLPTCPAHASIPTIKMEKGAGTQHAHLRIRLRRLRLAIRADRDVQGDKDCLPQVRERPTHLATFRL